jgi:Family of unknown function (DUF6428)
MKTSAFTHHLEQCPDHYLQFILPDGGLIPLHAHITEVGRVDKTFLDCGATVRKVSYLCLQSWVANDVEHRLPAGKLAEIIERAAPILGNDDLEVELEYEDGVITQFPVVSIASDLNKLVIGLGVKHTDCLAKDVCLPPPKDEEISSCCSGAGCC